ncbi:MAG: DNA-binding response regulator [Acidobacteria bacterium]|nr:MAG: DNA-binding response regulator [Acidobacteriota bacterium]
MHDGRVKRDDVDPGLEAAAEPCLRILLVDDHAVLREALSALLNETRGFEIVGSVGSVDEAVAILKRVDPSVIVLDMSMPGRSGIDLFAELRNRNSRARVVVLSAHASQEYVVAALNAGAAGYICKDAPSAQLVEGLRTVATGQMFLCVQGVVDAPVLSPCLHEESGDTMRAQTNLTPRERSVLRSIAGGQTNKRIARELGISIKTVEKHRSNVMRKLDLHNSAALALFAARQGIVSVWEDSQVDSNECAGEDAELRRRRQVASAA